MSRVPNTTARYDQNPSQSATRWRADSRSFESRRFAVAELHRVSKGLSENSLSPPITLLPAVMRPGILFSLVVATSLSLALGACSRSPDERPNLLLITLDTTRPDHLGLYGYEKPTSPNLDRLAKESVVYDHAYATSSWTLASHASLFTGLWPQQHGAQSVPEGQSRELGYGVRSLDDSFTCLLYTSPSPRDATLSRMPSSA